jgi:hypothetical protein
MMPVAFAKKKVAVLIAVKNIYENLSTVWVSDLRPQYAQRKWRLNACASGVCQREKKIIGARRSNSENRNNFAETNKNPLYHRNRNLMALNAHRQRLLLRS